MIALTLLAASLATAEPDVAVATDAVPDEWPGEQRRAHFGLGYRGHLGLMGSWNTPFLVLESELLGMLTIRLGPHNELRIEVGFATGYPDTLVGESNVSFRWGLGQHFALGIGAVAQWGFWSMRGGVEFPLAFRLDRSRRHELTAALRLVAGVFNDDTFVWYDFKHQQFAIAGDFVVGYSFIF